MTYKTEQEDFWAGNFGDDYIDRNSGLDELGRKKSFFQKILTYIEPIKSVLEFGANIGLNLAALKQLDPEIEISAVEINKMAFKELASLDLKRAYNTSILDFQLDYVRDLTISLGLLIHINPAQLPAAYSQLYSASSRYILVCESYSPVPVEVNYRGKINRYFKRDFTGEMQDLYRDLRLVEYGFAYHRDPNSLANDSNWFLLEKC